mgnify:CR=1 FL=1
MILIAELFTKKNSGEIARKRLKHLLTADRAGCSPELLDLIRADFLRSVSRYLEIDPGDVTLRILRTSSEQPAEVCVGAGSYFKEPFTA